MDLNVKDLRILNNTFDYPYSDLNVEFLNNIVKINTRIWIDKNEYVDVVGNSEMKLYGKGDFHIKSTKNVNLKKTLSWLVPIHDLIGFDIGPLPYMNLDGTGNIDINARGTILDGEIYGKLNFYNATAMLDGLSAIITGLDSSLFFDKKNITFKTNKAFLNKKLVKIDGTSNLDGKIDFDIVANSIKIEELLNILNTSPILEPQKVLVQPLEKAIGEANATIKITGIIKDFSKIKDNTTLKISGKLKLKNVTAKVKDLLFELVNTVGFIEFNNVGWNLDVSGLVGKKSKVFIKGFASDKNVEVSVKSDSVLLSDVWEVLSKINKIEYLKNFPKTSSFVSFDAVYKTPYGLKSNGFSLENLVANGKFKSLNKADVLNINQGTFFLNKGSLSLKDVGADFVTSKFFINAKIDKIFTQKPIINGKLKVDEYDVSNLNTIKQMNLLPTSLQNILVLYKDYSGRAAAQITCKNNYLDGIVELKNVKFTHVFFDTPVVIDSGKVVLDGTKIHLHSLVAQVDTIPVFINFSISDIDKTMKIDGYFTSKFNEYLANKYINSYLSYPIKPKGDITLTADISGIPDSVTIKPKIKLAQDADIYYMGANLGDESSQRAIVGDINIVGNNYTIKRIDYVRFMTSQNSKIYPLKIITANGVIEQNTKDKSFVVKNLNVETLNNANAKIFNVFFKKSVLKKGMFNCKLNFSGNYKAPQINGVVSFDNISMPLYDTIIKNIVLKFHDKSIDVKASGDVYNSDIKITAVIKNSFNKPYVIESLVVKSDKLNLNNLIDALTDIPTPNTATKLVEHPQSNNLPFDISDIQLKRGMLEVKDILIKDLPASNFLSEFTLGKDFVLNISKLVFDITTGKMTGTASYDFRNGKIKANVSALKVDSNKIASSLFGFKEQIFGQANGNIVIMTTGNSEQERIKNMAGFVYFEISDGKMPKLGSVEYLLKAGNFIKNGITGASLNNLIELLNPVKTGQFDSIKGKLALKNGVAQDIEIYSKGDNLNLFINGEFDILQQYANMRIMGRLTQKASGVLGPVGNLSLNSLLNSIPGIRLSSREKELLVNDLNKIPGAESSDQKYRLFTVKVDGNINDDKFVKNFRWIE